MQSQVPGLAEAQNYAVNRPGSAEVVCQSLYDFQIYAAAGTTQLNFFALPIGQGLSSSPGFAGNAKTKADTNMEAAGQLPAPKAFLVTSIEVVFQPGSVNTAGTFTPQVVSAASNLPGNAANDVEAVSYSGFLDFFIGSKSYLTEQGLFRFPPKSRTVVNAATGIVGEDIVKSTPSGNTFFLDVPVLLVPNQNFNITLNWPAAIAAPSGFNGRIGVILDGYLYRNSQ